jgi:hypothetical protein
MIIRLPGTGSVKAGMQKREPKRNRAGLFAVITFGAGGISGLAAMAGIWPFSGLQAFLPTIGAASHLVTGDPSTQIQASSIFPAVPPIHKVIDVYDPPPPAPRQQPAPPQPPATTPTPRHHPSPSPTPIHSSPSPSATPGGGDD